MPGSCLREREEGDEAASEAATPPNKIRKRLTSEAHQRAMLVMKQAKDAAISELKGIRQKFQQEFQ